MRIIKVFNDFINEELSPLTIYNTAQKFKEKGVIKNIDKRDFWSIW